MNEDARFEDTENPLRLHAETAEGLAVIATLLQDAAGKVGDVLWLPRRRRLAMVVNRFRWEDKRAAERARRHYERVRAGLHLDGALAVRARGMDPKMPDRVFNILDLVFEPAQDGAGTLRIICSEGVEIAADVECLDLTVSDMTKPWAARAAPEHSNLPGDR